MLPNNRPPHERQRRLPAVPSQMSSKISGISSMATRQLLADQCTPAVVRAIEAAQRAAERCALMLVVGRRVIQRLFIDDATLRVVGLLPFAVVLREQIVRVRIVVLCGQIEPGESLAHVLRHALAQEIGLTELSLGDGVPGARALHQEIDGVVAPGYAEGGARDAEHHRDRRGEFGDAHG